MIKGRAIPEDDPRIVQLAADHPDYRQTCVPIVLHGDVVPCTNNNSLDTIAFESLIAKRSHAYSAFGASTIDYIFFCTGVSHKLWRLRQNHVWATQNLNCGSRWFINFVPVAMEVGRC